MSVAEDNRNRYRSAQHAWILWAVAVVPIPLTTILYMKADPVVGAITTLMILAYPTIGALIASRRPENSIGWLFCAAGITMSVSFLGEASTKYSLASRPLPGYEWLAWISHAIAFAPLLTVFTFVCLLFPGGGLLSRRWRPLAWLAAGLIVVIVIHQAFASEFVSNGTVPNPLRAEAVADILDPLAVALFVGGPLVLLGSLLSLTLRLRRSRGVERQQLKWFVYVAAVGVSTFLLSGVVAKLDPENMGGWAGSVLWATALLSILLGLPIAVGIAILRYRLWDIDPIINRTLVYGALTAAVVGIYIIVVGWLGVLFQTSSNVLFSLIATGLVAVLFQPMREYVQRGVNRLMYGQRDEPYAVISRLGRRLEGAFEPGAVLPAIVSTITEALKLPYAAITLRQGDTLASVAATGTPVADPVRLPLVYHHEQVGELLLAPRSAGEVFSPADRRLLEDLARQAGVAAHAVRLNADLQQARERLVEAREEERRRLRRDLHDGLGSQLAALNMELGALRREMQDDPAAADALVQEIRSEIRAAIANIRQIAHDLRPPVLDDLGLQTATGSRPATHLREPGHPSRPARQPADLLSRD